MYEHWKIQVVGWSIWTLRRRLPYILTWTLSRNRPWMSLVAQDLQYVVVIMDGVGKIMWRTVTRSDNHPEIIVNFYWNCVAGLEGCPVKPRTDCGTESGVMAALQGAFQQDAKAHKYGSSPVNQRIEGWWVFYGRNSCCKACRKRLEYERSAWVLKPLLNPFTPKISLLILLTICHSVLVMLVLRIWYCINL